MDQPSPTTDALDDHELPVELPNRVGPTQLGRASLLRSRSGTHNESDPKTASAKVRASLAKISELYRYSEIGGTKARLLTILPKRSNDARGYKPEDIYATLSEVPQDKLGRMNESRYEALSYFWGPGEANNVIHLRDDAPMPQMPDATLPEILQMVKKQGVYKKFKVKLNLYQALRHLRQEKHPARYWIDALCIDQSNRNEKEAQVANMDKIYASADRVLIWLGPSNDRTKRAMEFISRVIDLNGHDVASEDGCVDDWNDFLYLMQREWFSRRWVIQELALARDPIVLCGADQKHWFDFRDAVSTFAHKADKIRELFKRSVKYRNDYNAIDESQALGARRLVESINNIFRSANSGNVYEPVQGLEYLVSTLFGFECSDPRDTINALRNIAKETSPSSRRKDRRKKYDIPGPDYGKNLLLVYVEFVRWVEMRTGSIDILCRQWALPERILSDEEREVHKYPSLVTLPSWIQQISKSPFGRQQESRGRIHGDSFVGLPGFATYNACCGKEACVQYGAFTDTSTCGTSPYTATGTGNAPIGVSAECANAAEHVDAARPHGQQLDASTQATRDAPDSNGAWLLSPEDSTTRRSKRSRNFAASDPDLPRAKMPKTSAAEASNRSTSAKTSPLKSNVRSTPKSPIPDGTRSRLNQAANAEQAALDVRDGTIWIEGLRIGAIDWMTDPMPDGIVPANVLQRLGHDAGSTTPPTDKLWRTLVAERGADGKNPPATYSRACWHCLANDSPNGNINTERLLMKGQREIVHEFLKRVQAVTWNRVLVEVKKDRPSPPVSDAGNMSPLPNPHQIGDDRTDATLGAPRIEIEDTNAPVPPSPTTSHIFRSSGDPIGLSAYDAPYVPLGNGSDMDKLHGLGPCEARTGDIVCILFGCSVPCILRPQYDDIGNITHYLFIGEVYIYGLMDGEALMFKSDERIKEEKIKFEIH